MRKDFSKKAVMSIDMAVAMLIFVSMVSIAFYYMTYMSKPKQPFEETLQSQGFGIAEKLAKNISWTLYKSPIIISSKNTSYASFEEYFRPSPAVDTNSIAVLDEESNEVASSFSENTLIWTSNVSAGKNLFYFVYTKNTSLSPRTYVTDLNASGLWANNSLIRVLFSSSGISSIIFDGAEMLGNGISFGTSSSPENNAVAVRAKVNYTNGVYAKIYSNISKIVIGSNNTFNPVLYLSSVFTSYYNGSANSFSGSGQQFNSVLNFTDVYSASRGVAVIGNNINVSVLNTTYREIRLYNVTEFEIYLHTGDYSNALIEMDMYVNPYSSVIGIPANIKGISTANMNLLSEVPYGSMKDAFSGSTNFNLTLETENISIGTTIPSDRNVMVIRYPATILGRLANTSDTYFATAVWMGVDY